MRLLLGLCALTATLAAQGQHEKRLVFSTFQGGDRNDDAVSVAVDVDGNLYVAGESESRDLPGTPVGGKPLTSAVFKGYLTKYAPDGKKVIWRAILGGSSNTVPHAVALDNSGNVYVAGTTGARDFPLKNPVQDQQTGLNICFLMKFNREGELQFSTYFGGDRNEEGLALAIDSQGAMYLAGRATSTNLPVKNALQSTIGGGGQDGFIAKFTADYKLAYATYLGGTAGTDNIHSIAIGPDDSLYVTGDSMSPDLSTPGAYIPLPQTYSSFAARIAPAGDAVMYFTYVGWKGGYTKAQAVAVDPQGRAYVTGHTTSKQLPTNTNAVQPNYAGGFKDAFLLRLDAEGKSAEYLTYLGGSYTGTSDPDETAVAVKVDGHGYVYVAGETTSPDFPSVRAVRASHGGDHDAYLLRLDVDNSRILSSTFWGGTKRDSALALAIGRGELVTFVGETFSVDFPTFEALQTKIGSTNDSFVAQICDPWLSTTAAPAFSYVVGSDRPGAVVVQVASGCPQPFEATEVTIDQPWASIVADGRSVPLKLTVTVNPDGLAAGAHTAIIRVTVPEALHPVLEIPVTFTVAEPPKVEEPTQPAEPPVAPAEPSEPLPSGE